MRRLCGGAEPRLFAEVAALAFGDDIVNASRGREDVEWWGQGPASTKRHAAP